MEKYASVFIDHPKEVIGKSIEIRPITRINYMKFEEDDTIYLKKCNEDKQVQVFYFDSFKARNEYNPKKVLLESLTDRNQYGSLVLDMGSYTLCNKSCKEFKIVEALNLQSESSKIDWKDDSWLNIVAEYFNGTVVRSSVLSM